MNSGTMKLHSVLWDRYMMTHMDHISVLERIVVEIIGDPLDEDNLKIIGLPTNQSNNADQSC